LLFTQIFGDIPLSSHSTFISLPDEQELSAVSRNTEVDLFTQTEIKPGTSTGNTTATAVPDAPDVPDAPLVPVEILETFAITGTVVPTALPTFLFFGLTGFTGFTVFTFLDGTVVLVALVGITDTAGTATLNESDATLPAALATDTLDETHDTITMTKTNNRLPTTTPSMTAKTIKFATRTMTVYHVIKYMQGINLVSI
jgi:hypothetical protein